MPKKLVSYATVIALLCCFCATASAANSDPKEPPAKPASASEKIQPNEKLKADVGRMVSEVKAAKFKMPAQQFPQPTRNNLSTGAKIGIVAAIAGAVVLILVIKHITHD